MSDRRYLATEEGLLRFQWILAAIYLWRDRLTPVQRRVLKAGGGECAKVTAEKLTSLNLTRRNGDDLCLTELGRFVVQANEPHTSITEETAQ